MRTSWPGGGRLGREPGVQAEVPAGTPAFGMGGITMPPRDLCIFSSLQCRYCWKIFTCQWGWGRGRGQVQETFHSGCAPPGHLSQGHPFYPEPPGRQCWQAASGFSCQPPTWDPGLIVSSPLQLRRGFPYSHSSPSVVTICFPVLLISENSRA